MKTQAEHGKDRAADQPPTGRGRPSRWIVLAVILIVLGSFIPFAREDLLFGLTSQFLRIADTTLEQGCYANRLSDGTVIPEVVREPLYAGVLMLARSARLNLRAIVLLQWLALGAAYYLWLRAVQARLGARHAVLVAAFLLLAPVPAFYASVLYPYAFQFLLLLAGLLSIDKALRSGRLAWYAAAGAFLAAACYERGGYLLLPVFLVVVLLAFRRRLGVRLSGLALMLLLFAAAVFPWLHRNAQLGVRGMNGMMGYTLGFTYGELPGGQTGALRERYDLNVETLTSDYGTWRTIEEEVMAGHGTWQEADRRVMQLVLGKIRANPWRAVERFLKNIVYAPSRLLDAEVPRFLLGRGSAIDVHTHKAVMVVPRLPDLLVAAFALLGMLGVARRAPRLFWPGLAIALYLLLMSTTIVIFDPRYRNIADLVIYVCAAEGLLCILPRAPSTEDRAPSVKGPCRACGAEAVRPFRASPVGQKDLAASDFAITDSRYGTTGALEQCLSCGFIQCTELGEVVGFYEQLEDPTYDQDRTARGLQFHMLLKLLARHVSKGRLLDVGAGTGMLVEEALAMGFSAEGIEPSRWMVGRAAERHLPVRPGTLPHPDIAGPFDAVTLVDIVEHVADPYALLKAVRPLLAKDACVLIVTPDVESVAARALGARWWHYRIAHIGYFSRRSLRILLARAGFEIVSIRHAGWFFPLDYLVERMRRYLPRWLPLKCPSRLGRLIVPVYLFDSMSVICRPKT